MKYLQPKFTSPSNSDAYRKGWDATFGKCRDCSVSELKHQDDHPELCCDCFDRRLGKPDDYH